MFLLFIIINKRVYYYFKLYLPPSLLVLFIEVVKSAVSETLISQRISDQNERSVAIYNLREQDKDSVEVVNSMNSIMGSA